MHLFWRLLPLPTYVNTYNKREARFYSIPA